MTRDEIIADPENRFRSCLAQPCAHLSCRDSIVNVQAINALKEVIKAGKKAQLRWNHFRNPERLGDAMDDFNNKCKEVGL